MVRTRRCDGDQFEYHNEPNMGDKRTTSNMLIRSLETLYKRCNGSNLSDLLALILYYHVMRYSTVPCSHPTVYR